MKSVDELWRLLHEARQLPYGAAQIALVEQVLRHADAAGDRELAYAARIFATTAYVYGGEQGKSFVTFAWLLADHDRDPAPFHATWEHNLLWYFKYMVVALTKFPEVPLSRTYAVLDDMERRYREGGHSLQAVYKHRFLVARHVGDLDAAAGWYERWLTTPRDDLSDCAGCDPSAQVSWLAFQGRDDEAVALAEPVLAGRLTCTEQPQGILIGLLEPYVRTGRGDAAADAHRRAYRLVRGNVADLWDIGDHIAFCARTGNEHRGLEILQRHVDWLDRAPSPAAGMVFAASAALLLRRLAATGHGAVPVHRRSAGDTPAAELGEELAAYATALAARFDARNGTGEQGRRVAERLGAAPFPDALPLSPSARRAPAAVPVAVAVPAPEPARVPADASAAELLDLAERYADADADEAVAAVLAAFDARFPEPADALLAARRTDVAGDQSWLARDAAGAMAAWRSAAERYAAAGDERRAHRSRAAWGVAACLTGDAEAGAEAVAADLAYQLRAGGEPARLAAAWARQALALAVTGRGDAALAAFGEADAVAAGAGDERLTARIALRRATTLANLGRGPEAAEAAAPAVAFYRAHGPADRFAAAALVVAAGSPDPVAAVAAASDALAAGPADRALDARLARARALVAQDRPGDAVADYVEVVALCAERGLDAGGAAARHELAAAYRDAGRLVEAAEVAEEAVTWWTRLDAVPAADDSRFVLAGVYSELGETAQALALYDELVGRLGGNDAGRGQVEEQAAELLFRADRDADAARRFEAAAQAYAAAGDVAGELRVLRRRLTALHWADDVAAAEAVLAQAVRRHDALPPELAGEPPLVWERAVLGHEAGRLLMARGRFAEALPYLDGAPERLRSIGATGDADRLAVMAGEALLRAGRPADAAELLAGALAGLGARAPGRAGAAGLLAEALDELGRFAEAAALRAEHGLDD
ncbi:tetratricopeptide repeat protein [Spirilliplanes yamanashiensis]|uniref:Tetratricopeptide repeat protein n=1 Tax=Spirilliplanes yamanashiensis TaxID=42233 RepID=A0A8J3Y6A4_9ACTN|nr:tetratricopeptide repeat protein [Spirilliplanes yamanashiensis]MDP9814986.1 tetratricopeptide (TPR) repeat protein [Spirilliplanes yamanashiensis]GIJ02641.1 hypothetical protein Sya03_19930 [Spirilliplanes yamanashiensis]